MLTRQQVLDIIYPRGRRFTQDTAVMPDVWIAYGTAADPNQPIELLLCPHAASDVEALAAALPAQVFPLRNESHVLVNATFHDLIRAIIPLSEWWRRSTRLDDVARIVQAIQPELVDELDWVEPSAQPPLWAVFRNRPAEGAVTQSRRTVKADAAARVFDLSCRDLVWGVIDSGIDATHPAFQRADGGSRVLRTYDFTRLKPLLADRLLRREAIDWRSLEPLLRVPHDPSSYYPPENEHGTHVAGIMAAEWRCCDGGRPNMVGICPDIELLDLRVFDKDGQGDEFTILAALQFVRYLNRSRDRQAVHGVNLSFSLAHAVDSFACGSTPVCEECERLTASGVVVVAAAGNRGYRDGEEDYRNISITDPGNAEGVITVGATHRFMPHKYGVSYFSSRGPTGDGRLKPDLVAPGEKIESTIPGGRWATLDGTSMAAPHVSGAAALLMARHRELIGKPVRIKEILCRTATSLNRERAFQGAGLVDVLRALQSV